jgi:hypothetical protein
MIRSPASFLLALALAAAPVAAQVSGTLGNRDNGLGSRSLPDQGVVPNRLPDRLPDRELPTLQDRLDLGGAPPAIREDFDTFCKLRGCPGGYIQNQAEFNAYQYQQRQQQREQAERDLQRRYQQQQQQQNQQQ